MRTVRFVGGIPFIGFEPEPTDTPVSFDGGVRVDTMTPPPRPQWIHDPEERGGWQSVELEDGASLPFPHMRVR